MTILEKNNILHGLVSPDVHLVEGMNADASTYQYLRHGYNTDFTSFNDVSIDELILAAFKLIAPTWTPLNMICTDLISKEIWIDKTTPIIVASVSMDSDGALIVSESGRTYSQECLWLKE